MRVRDEMEQARREFRRLLGDATKAGLARPSDGTKWTNQERPGGRRLDRHGAGRIVRRIARRAGITKSVGPHTLRHAFIAAALDAGVPLRDVQEAVAR